MPQKKFSRLPYKKPTQKLTGKGALQKTVHLALSHIDHTYNLRDNVIEFLINIDMEVCEKLVIEAFMDNVDNYNVILEHLHKRHPEKEALEIEEILDDYWNNWLLGNPSLLRNFPEVTLMDLIRCFTDAYKDR
jgi:hypothetical protein